ncbi:MAG: PilN domain-containing protein [bacterium]|nr:PilN domain-containing protein [bacterium]
MREIDFVPIWYHSAQRRRHDLAVRVSCLCALVAVMVAWSVRNLATARAAEAELAMMQESLAAQDILLEHSGLLQGRLNELQARGQILRTLRGGARARQVLAELSHLMPDAMVMTRIAFSQDRRLPGESGADDGPTAQIKAPASASLELEGLAAGHAQVGSLLDALDRSEWFVDVEMGYSTPLVHRGHKARSFQLVCRVPRFE